MADREPDAAAQAHTGATAAARAAEPAACAAPGDCAPAAALDGCFTASAGGGFVNIAIPRATVLDHVTFNATPSAPNIDAVIGLAAAPATQFDDLAAAIRFAPSGALDSRDGDVYRADHTHAYRAGDDHDFSLVADLTTHTYSARVGSEGSGQSESFSAGYGFRTSQRTVAELDVLSLIVDGPVGTVTICDVSVRPSTNLAYTRDGTRSVLPLPGDDAVLGDGVTATRVDSAGHPVARTTRVGAMAADAVGNSIYIASLDNTTLTITTHEPDLSTRATTATTIPAGSGVAALAVTPSGTLRVAVRTGANVAVSRLTAAGALTPQFTTTASHFVFDGDDAIVLANTSGTLQVSRLGATGATVWTRAFSGTAAIGALTVDPQHAVLFGGSLSTDMNFGGDTLEPHDLFDEKVTGFAVKLASDGSHVFSRLNYSEVHGLASNGERVAISSTQQIQFRFAHLDIFDAGGAPLAPGFSTGFNDNGDAFAVSMNASGRMWWNMDMRWPLFPQYPYLLVIKP